jgi:hypothetical protein
MYNKIIELALSENEANKNIAHGLILSHFYCTPKEAWAEINCVIPKHMTGDNLHANARIEALNLMIESGYKCGSTFKWTENYGYFIKIGDMYNSRIVTPIINRHDNFKVEYVGRYTKKRILFDLSVLKELGIPENLYQKFDKAIKSKVEYQKLRAEGKKLKQLKILIVGYLPRCYYRDMEKLELKYNLDIKHYTGYKNNLPFKDYDVVIHDRAIDVGIPNVIITHYDSIKGPNVFRRIDESTIKYIRTLLSTTSTEV